MALQPERKDVRTFLLFFFEMPFIQWLGYAFMLFGAFLVAQAQRKTLIARSEHLFFVAPSVCTIATKIPEPQISEPQISFYLRGSLSSNSIQITDELAPGGQLKVRDYSSGTLNLTKQVPNWNVPLEKKSRDLMLYSTWQKTADHWTKQGSIQRINKLNFCRENRSNIPTTAVSWFTGLPDTVIQEIFQTLITKFEQELHEDAVERANVLKTLFDQHMAIHHYSPGQMVNLYLNQIVSEVMLNFASAHWNLDLSGKGIDMNAVDEIDFFIRGDFDPAPAYLPDNQDQWYIFPVPYDTALQSCSEAYQRLFRFFEPVNLLKSDLPLISSILNDYVNLSDDLSSRLNIYHENYAGYLPHAIQVAKIRFVDLNNNVESMESLIATANSFIEGTDAQEAFSASQLNQLLTPFGVQVLAENEQGVRPLCFKLEGLFTKNQLLLGDIARVWPCQTNDLSLTDLINSNMRLLGGRDDIRINGNFSPNEMISHAHMDFLEDYEWDTAGRDWRFFLDIDEDLRELSISEREEYRLADIRRVPLKNQTLYGPKVQDFLVKTRVAQELRTAFINHLVNNPIPFQFTPEGDPNHIEQVQLVLPLNPSYKDYSFYARIFFAVKTQVSLFEHLAQTNFQNLYNQEGFILTDENLPCLIPTVKADNVLPINHPNLDDIDRINVNHHRYRRNALEQ